jgi:hypothetical protein
MSQVLLQYTPELEKFPHSRAGIHSLTIPVSQNTVSRKSRAGTQPENFKILVLAPGVNKVQEKDWTLAQEHELIKERIAKGVIKEFKKKTIAEDQSYTNTLADYPLEELRVIIQNTWDERELDKLISQAGGVFLGDSDKVVDWASAQRDAIRKQTEGVTINASNNYSMNRA